MTGSATDYLRQRVLSHSLGFGAFAMPAQVFMAICTTATPPTSATPGSEVVGGGYTRRQGVFVAVGGRPDLATNSATVDWPAATSGWGTVGYIEVWDALAGGNRLYWGPLLDPADNVTLITRTVLTGDIMRMPAGNFSVQAI